MPATMAPPPSPASPLSALLAPPPPPHALPALTPAFSRAASALLASCVLVATPRNGPPEEFSLAEIEFYASPIDPYAHGAADQQLHCGWYVHQLGPRKITGNAPNVKRSFVEGTRKGLDLALAGHGLRCGVLLRGLLGPGGERVDGPSRVVERLCATVLRGTEGYDAMARGKFRGPGVARALFGLLASEGNGGGLDALHPLNALRIEHRRPAGNPTVRVIAGPRVGLPLKTRLGVPGGVEAFALPWRFVSLPASGPGAHTVLGIFLARMGVGGVEDREGALREAEGVGAKRGAAAGMLDALEGGYRAGKEARKAPDGGEDGRPAKRRRGDPPPAQSPTALVRRAGEAGTAALAWCLGFSRGYCGDPGAPFVHGLRAGAIRS